MKTKYLVTFLIVLIILALGSTLGFVIYENQKTAKVKVFKKAALFYPFFVAEEKGFFNDEKIDIGEVEQLERTNGISWNDQGRKFRQWLKSEEVDVAVLSTDELFNIEIDYPGYFKAFAFVSDDNNNYSASIITKNDSDISSVKDLEGKKIAASSDVNYFLLSRFMSFSKIDSYKPQKVFFNQWSQYIQEGKIDAMWTNELYVSKTINDNTSKKLVENPNNNPKTGVSGVISNVIAIRSGFIDNNPEIANSLKEAILKASGVDKDEIRKIAMEYYEDNEDVINATEIRTYPRIQSSTQLDKALFQKLADLMFEEEYISKKINTNNLIY